MSRVTSETPTPTEAEYARAIASVEEELGTLFRRARSMWKESAAAIHPDLQPIGYKILASLVNSGPAHAGALAELLAIDKSVMSRQVRTLEELDLAVSTPDPADGRARILSPTPLARERIGVVRATNQALLNQRLHEWTPEELQHFAEMLGRLAETPVPRIARD